MKREPNPRYITPDYPSPVEVLKEGSYVKSITEAEDGSDQSNVFQIDDDGGTVLIKPTNTIITSKHSIEKYEISNTNPLSTKATVTNTLGFDWPDSDGDGQPINTKIFTNGELWADREQFHTRHKAVVHLNDEIIFEKSWEDSYPRNYS